MRYSALKLILVHITVAFVFQLYAQPSIEFLRSLGLKQIEVDSTLSINGENGVDGYFLLYRQEISTKGVVKRYLELYSSKDSSFVNLPNNRFTDLRVPYFKLMENQIFIVETDAQLPKMLKGRKTIRISKFSLSGEKQMEMSGENPLQKFQWM